MTAARDAIRSVEILDELSPQAAQAVFDLIEEAAEHDGQSAVSEQGRLQLRRRREGVRHLLLRQGGELAGYAQLEDTDPVEAPAAELVVRPALRHRGHGRALGQELLALSGRRLRVWAHGGHPAARHLSGALGLALFRELRQMRRPLDRGPELPEPVLPRGVTVRTFVPGKDDSAWLAVNAAAFSHHPEQGSWTREDLADRFAEPWFDPEGFFLAVRGGGEEGSEGEGGGDGERVVGFHWTKIHKQEQLGEVYVLGVHPSEQGTGLGKALTAIGLRHLALTQPTAMLYVDADNVPAVTVYERLGFTVHDVDLMYRTET
ncbi:mycothiol synthase [Wenjunlia tyrosinilytica]|uniref:Mycothiol acetyltransferase n=1 Tax=Wenjunlia tyrosinilytica TaxID=1544741 RepID=A0A917ZNJ2_9ACTN|nr:mycothiol synthase [Wenjunlia tyrosinilytica]GGO87312.1 mycothiol acetyltransferase [Wenjunlia tyrosinilytica]